jgi:hypothetical protein
LYLAPGHLYLVGWWQYAFTPCGFQHIRY